MPTQTHTKRPSKRTKIVATIGPASDNEDTLRRMILAGLDVVRVNFSHSTHDYLKPIIKRIRKLSKEMGIPIPIIGDLSGPWIRVGKIEGSTVDLKAARQTCLTP